MPENPLDSVGNYNDTHYSANRGLFAAIKEQASDIVAASTSRVQVSEGSVVRGAETLEGGNVRIYFDNGISTSALQNGLNIIRLWS